MQELRKENFQQEIVAKKYPIPEQDTGVIFEVMPDHKGKAVVLKIGAQSINMSLVGARDLARALRECANKVERGK